MLFEHKFETRTKGLVCGVPTLIEPSRHPLPHVGGSYVSPLVRAKQLYISDKLTPLNTIWQPFTLHHKVMLRAREGGEILWQRPFRTIEEALFCQIALAGIDNRYPDRPFDMPGIWQEGEFEFVLAHVATFNASIDDPNRDWFNGGTRCPLDFTYSNWTTTTNSSVNWTAGTNGGTKAVSTPINYIIVGGGGGGGGGTYTNSYSQGGGGAGGFISATAQAVTVGTNYPITVGTGGNGGVGDLGGDGTSSSFNSVTSLPGGGGAWGSNSSGANGNGGSGTYGSGGGSSAGFTGGAGTAGQGNSGGNSSVAAPGYGGGGGGGSGGIGGTGTSTNGGNGGTGTSSSISGSDLFYSGGGGGGVFVDGTAAGSGGSSIGGAGGKDAIGSNATANRGSGGGGGGSGTTANNGGNGSAGLVGISWSSSSNRLNNAPMLGM